MTQVNSAGDRGITIVSGLPRSGTSMMMQMLAAGGLSILTDNVREADDDNPRGYYEFERVKQTDDVSWVEQAQGKVVKMVYRLLYSLPRNHTYRVVFMMRQIDEVIASQETMLRRHGKAGDQPENDRLADIYRRQLREVKDWLHDQPNFQVHYVDYHDVLHDAERVVRDLNRFLGGRLDTGAMLQVPDAALYRQRRTAETGTL